jgi:hypothetical protein
MASFYERLSVPQGSSEEQIRAGYHACLARLVKKLRAARAQGADTTVIEARRDEVREAFEVLTDGARRRRYDLFLRLDAEGLPHDGEGLWEQVESGLVDPTSAAAVEVLRSLTGLPVGPPFTPPEDERTDPAPAPVVSVPRPKAVSLLSTEERSARAQHATAPVPEPAGLSMPTPTVAPVVDPAGLLRPEQPLAEATWDLSTSSNELDHVARNVGFDGQYLASVREARGMDLDTLSNTTKIATRYLEAIEANAYDRLPAAVFVRGYLREVAAVLEIDEGPLVEGYMALFTRSRGG